MIAACPVTIALCTKDRPGPLADVLIDVLAQAPAAARVVVVDQSAELGKAQTGAWITARGDARVRYLRADPRGLPHARNLALAQAQGRVVIFLDDDTHLSPGCIDAHLAAFEDPSVGGVVGRITERVLAPNAPAGTCRVDWSGRPRTHLDAGPAGEVASLKGANMSFRRLALAAVGGFDEGYTGTAYLEEADVAARLVAAGWKLWFTPDAHVAHLSAPSGGCRLGPAEAEAARFHNTGRWVGQHRALSAPLVVATFAAIAVRRAYQWRDPLAPVRLVGALGRGLTLR